MGALSPGGREADKHRVKRLSPRLERLIAAAALGVAFLFMASVFVPDFIQAQPLGRPGAGPGSIRTDLHSLGSIEDDRYIVHIFSGPDAPLYSVFDRADGTELGVLMSAELAAERFPDLPIPDMDFGVGSPIMLVDPDDRPY